MMKKEFSGLNNLKRNKMYRNIFEALEKRLKEFNSLIKTYDNYIENLQNQKNELQKTILKQAEQIRILEAELQYAQSEINKGLTD